MTLVECLAGVTTVAVQERGVSFVPAIHGMLGGLSGVTAEVRGSEDYDLNVRLAENGLVVSCTCPSFFEGGSVCTHLWAVALAADARGLLQDLPEGLEVIADRDGDLFEDDETLIADLASTPPRRGPSSRLAPRRPDAWEAALASVIPAPRSPAASVST